MENIVVIMGLAPSTGVTFGSSVVLIVHLLLALILLATNLWWIDKKPEICNLWYYIIVHFDDCWFLNFLLSKSKRKEKSEEPEGRTRTIFFIPTPLADCFSRNLTWKWSPLNKTVQSVSQWLRSLLQRGVWKKLQCLLQLNLHHCLGVMILCNWRWFGLQ